MNNVLFRIVSDEIHVESVELEYLVEHSLEIAKKVDMDVSFDFEGVSI